VKVAGPPSLNGECVCFVEKNGKIVQNFSKWFSIGEVKNEGDTHRNETSLNVPLSQE
jgi:hypothetical protein